MSLDNGCAARNTKGTLAHKAIRGVKPTHPDSFGIFTKLNTSIRAAGCGQSREARNVPHSASIVRSAFHTARMNNSEF